MSTRGAELISQITNANHPAEEAVNENAEENNALDITAQSNASKKQLVNHHLLAANDLIGFCGGVHNGVALDADQMAKNLANAQRSGKSIVARVGVRNSRTTVKTVIELHYEDEIVLGTS